MKQMLKCWGISLKMCILLKPTITSYFHWYEDNKLFPLIKPIITPFALLSGIVGVVNMKPNYGITVVRKKDRLRKEGKVSQEIIRAFYTILLALFLLTIKFSAFCFIIWLLLWIFLSCYMRLGICYSYHMIHILVYLGKCLGLHINHKNNGSRTTLILITYEKLICILLGGYDMEEKAAKAYDLAALKYRGPSTYINFPVWFNSDSVQF